MVVPRAVAYEVLTRAEEIYCNETEIRAWVDSGMSAVEVVKKGGYFLMNYNSAPSELKITDIRFADIDGTPKHYPLMKIYTNQGIIGYGEVRDASSRTYAAMLKSRLVGENPCNVEKLFRRIKQFGFHSRQGGGVSGIEVALWDLAGKAYGVPVCQLIGGRYRDRIRIYCDTDVEGRHTGREMGLALKKRMEMGFTFLKMDLGIGLLMEEPGALTAPIGFLEEMRSHAASAINAARGSLELRETAGRAYEIATIAHPFTGIRIIAQRNGPAGGLCSAGARGDWV